MVETWSETTERSPLRASCSQPWRRHAPACGRLWPTERVNYIYNQRASYRRTAIEKRPSECLRRPLYAGEAFTFASTPAGRNLGPLPQIGFSSHDVVRCCYAKKGQSHSFLHALLVLHGPFVLGVGVVSVKPQVKPSAK
jgi:hypothetical protein